MGRLVITQDVTVDGVVEALDDWFAPQEGTRPTSSTPSAST